VRTIEAQERLELARAQFGEESAAALAAAAQAKRAAAAAAEAATTARRLARAPPTDEGVVVPGSRAAWAKRAAAAEAEARKAAEALTAAERAKAALAARLAAERARADAAVAKLAAVSAPPPPAPAPEAEAQAEPAATAEERPFVAEHGAKVAAQPTATEISEYAVYLGIDDPAFHYIAAWALTAPLPAGWLEHTDEDGNEYFHNDRTGVCTFAHPLDELYRSYWRRLKEGEPPAAGPAVGDSEAALVSRMDTVRLGTDVAALAEEGECEGPQASVRLPPVEEELGSRGRMSGESR